MPHIVITSTSSATYRFRARAERNIRIVARLACMPVAVVFFIACAQVRAPQHAAASPTVQAGATECVAVKSESLTLSPPDERGIEPLAGRPVPIFIEPGGALKPALLDVVHGNEDF